MVGIERVKVVLRWLLLAHPFFVVPKMGGSLLVAGCTQRDVAVHHAAMLAGAEYAPGSWTFHEDEYSFPQVVGVARAAHAAVGDDGVLGET
jgi:hypothetical protein